MIEIARFKEHRFVFILGMICLLLSIVLIVGSFYCLPYLLWQLHYSVPEYVIRAWSELVIFRQWNNTYAALLIFFSMLFLGIILAILAVLISRFVDKKIDKDRYQQQIQAQEKRRSWIDWISFPSQSVESASLLSKILLYGFIALIILFSVEWLISVPAP